MSISVSNLLGKTASIYERASSFFNYEPEGSASVLQFLNMISKYGTLMNANYEVSFSFLFIKSGDICYTKIRQQSNSVFMLFFCVCCVSDNTR